MKKLQLVFKVKNAKRKKKVKHKIKVKHKKA